MRDMMNDEQKEMEGGKRRGREMRPQTRKSAHPSFNESWGTKWIQSGLGHGLSLAHVMEPTHFLEPSLEEYLFSLPLSFSILFSLPLSNSLSFFSLSSSH